MKANGTQKNIIVLFFFTLLVTASSVLQAQPDYRFENPVLESGTDGAVGAVYRFPNAKPGIDALVSVDAIAGGAILSNIDRTADGFQEAFQPQLKVASLSNGYADFTITFVLAGTNTPQVQTQVDATGLDIDGQTNGAAKLYEYNSIDMGGGVADFNTLGGQLTVAQAGTAFTATNFTGVLYGASVDTSAYDVMFTVMRGNISSFKFRAGANSLLPGPSTRYASLYFKRFHYANSLLSAPALLSFNGNVKDKKVSLQWSLSTDNTVKEIIVERSNTATQFVAINAENYSTVQAGYTDNTILQGNTYYRLKLVSVNGQVQYSNVLVFRGEDVKKSSFKMYPSVVNDNATISISAGKSEQTNLQLVDLGGRTVYQKNISLQAGDNSLSVNGFSQVQPGTYIAVVKSGNDLFSQKIMIQ